jgi:hypothetical protein
VATIPKKEICPVVSSEANCPLEVLLSSDRSRIRRWSWVVFQALFDKISLDVDRVKIQMLAGFSEMKS